METKTTKLKNYIEQLPHKDVKQFTTLLIERCGITRQTLYIWRKNDPKSQMAKNVINDIAILLFNQPVY